MANTDSALPKWMLRIGTVTGAIWERRTELRPSLVLNLTCSGRDEQGPWADCSLFDLNEALAAQTILEHAVNKMVEMSATG